MAMLPPPWELETAILVGVFGIVENRVGLKLESQLQQVFKPLSQLLNLSKLMFSPLKWD